MSPFFFCVFLALVYVVCVMGYLRLFPISPEQGDGGCVGCAASRSVEGSSPDFIALLFPDVATYTNRSIPVPSVNIFTSTPPGDFNTVWTCALFAVPLLETSRLDVPPPSDEVLSVFLSPDFYVESFGSV